MGSLLEEYRKRHKISCVWPVNEGILFFEKQGKPAAIAVTSSYTKSLSVCPACPLNPDSIILEIYHLYKFPKCVKRITHTHMPPDADLIDYICNHVPKGEEYSPYISSGERDQERWLWELFLLTSPFAGHSKWESFLQTQKTTDPKLVWLEQAFWATLNAPAQFKTYYNAIYSVCMVNRCYILTD